jgi:hypothetical protein
VVYFSSLVQKKANASIGCRMKHNFGLYRALVSGVVSAMMVLQASAALVGYWPLNETSGAVAPNLAPGGTQATLFNDPTWVTDPVRGQALEFDGLDDYGDAGTLPILDLPSLFTWSFWSFNNQGPNNNVVLGNRYAPGNIDFVPREFTKFTNQQFEWHHDGIGENIDYVDMPGGEWIHNLVVKDGNTLISYRNGLVNGYRTITAGLINPQPFYFGGNAGLEPWGGRLDDVAIWTDALPHTSAVGLAKGTFTPTNAPRTGSVPPAKQTVFSDNFSAGISGKWTPTDRGLENNAPAGYNPPDTADGTLSLSGTTNQQYWFGNSIESIQRFSATVETTVTVDRISLTGSGTAYRSSLWILGDDGHYIHFSQNVGELGWSWNARDDGGVGTLNPTGSGNNILALDALDGDLGQHQMQIEVIPTGAIGEVNIFLALDGARVAGQGFSAFPADFQVVLTGQARAGGDTVNAIFDNLVVAQVPEPSAVFLLAGAALAATIRRRSR